MSCSHKSSLEGGGILSEKKSEDGQRKEKRNREVRVSISQNEVQTIHTS